MPNMSSWVVSRLIIFLGEENKDEEGEEGKGEEEEEDEEEEEEEEEGRRWRGMT